MFLQRMALLIFILTLAACLQAENSNTLDASNYGDNGGGTPEFVAAKAVFAQNCTSCHVHNYHTQTEAQLKDAGLFVPGDPDNSKLYYRLTGSGGSQGPKDMPQGSAMSSSDVLVIDAWIQNATP